MLIDKLEIKYSTELKKPNKLYKKLHKLKYNKYFVLI